MLKVLTFKVCCTPQQHPVINQLLKQFIPDRFHLDQKRSQSHPSWFPLPYIWIEMFTPSAFTHKWSSHDFYFFSESKSNMCSCTCWSCSSQKSLCRCKFAFYRYCINNLPTVFTIFWHVLTLTVDHLITNFP